MTTIPATAVADTTEAVHTPRDALDETAAIVEGYVAKISYSYDPQQGPRSNAHLVDVVTHAGAVMPKALVLPTFGGPLPDGTAIEASDQAELEEGERYVIFLTAADWFFSPVVSDYAFRVEANDRIVNQTGNPVTRVTQTAVQVDVRSVDPNVREILAPRRLVPEAASILSVALSRDTFVADAVQLYERRAPRFVAAPRTFKPTPRADRVWNLIGGSADDAAMCEQVVVPAVCQ